MKKINQEEYEVLKGLDGRWKWITRDRVTELWVYTEKPSRKGYRWGSGGHFKLLPHRIKYLFQFIQWKDEEPYEISELIEEYESEGIEVKKDKLWAKNKIQEELDSWRNIEVGTTAIAAMDTNRKFIGFEIDEDYYNMAKERIENHKVAE